VEAWYREGFEATEESRFMRKLAALATAVLVPSGLPAAARANELGYENGEKASPSDTQAC
jgi:hypothetical protein